MLFKLVLDTDCDAFRPCAGDEVARLLEKVAYDVLTVGITKDAGQHIQDANGNTVGSWRVVS